MGPLYMLLMFECLPQCVRKIPMGQGIPSIEIQSQRLSTSHNSTDHSHPLLSQVILPCSSLQCLVASHPSTRKRPGLKIDEGSSQPPFKTITIIIKTASHTPLCLWALNPGTAHWFGHVHTHSPTPLSSGSFPSACGPGLTP